MALDADTGKLKWHYQFTPHDVHDWDAISDPVLVDLKIKGKPVKAVVHANRNGFFYALDRATGKVLATRSYTKVTWADGIGADGRPNLIAGQDPTEEGNKSVPGHGRRAQLASHGVQSRHGPLLFHVHRRLPHLLQDEAGFHRGAVVSGQHQRDPSNRAADRVDPGGGSGHRGDEVENGDGDPAHQRAAGDGGRTGVRRRSRRLPDGARRVDGQAAVEISDRRHGDRAADQLLAWTASSTWRWRPALPSSRSGCRSRPARPTCSTSAAICGSMLPEGRSVGSFSRSWLPSKSAKRREAGGLARGIRSARAQLT